VRHFLDIHTTSPAELRRIIDTGRATKDARKGKPKGALDRETPLKDHVVALIFEKPSTRTRVSFDVGVRQMGGSTMVLSGADMQLGHGEEFDLVFTGPPPLDPEKSLDGLYSIERDPHAAVEGADLVVTDTWVSMHDPQSARERRHNQLRGYQVNRALMDSAKPDALFMHCLPAHRDDEATSEVMDRVCRPGLWWMRCTARARWTARLRRWGLGVT